MFPAAHDDQVRLPALSHVENAFCDIAELGDELDVHRAVRERQAGVFELALGERVRAW